MLVHGKPYRTIWLEADSDSVHIIDQRKLPFQFETVELQTTEDTCVAIRDMWVRGAGCIGAVAAHGMYLAAKECSENSYSSSQFDQLFTEKGEILCSTRPTAMNLRWAVERQWKAVKAEESIEQKLARSRRIACEIADEDADWCRQIGEHGLSLLREIYEKKKDGSPLRILTHCNAGWLAFVDHGSATAPIYAAHDAGIPVHVWVDETRPRNQGARLTAWELGQHGVPHSVIVDNAGGHLMQQGLVDVVITGTDRTTYTGDVANKIGTYLKALAARDNEIPFYVALPSSTFDWSTRAGVQDIPIEERDAREVTHLSGVPFNSLDQEEIEVRLGPEDSPANNPAFDVTPARLVTSLITERGVCEAREESILSLFPEKREAR